MKKIYLTILSSAFAFVNVLNAQFNFFEPIKSPVNYPQTLMDQLYIGYPNVITQDPDGASWINREKISSNLNTQGNLTMFAQSEWNLTTSAWNTPLTAIDFTYTYNGADNMTSYIRNYYDAGALVMSRTTTSMLYNNNKLQAIYYDDVIQGTSISGKDTFIYNGSNLLTEKVSYYMFGGFENAMNRVLYTYTGTNVTEELYQSPDNGVWLDDSKATYTYDGQNRMLTYDMIDYDQTNLVWLNDETNAYTYATNGKLATHERFSNWDGSNYVDSEKNIYTYDGSDKLIEIVSQTYDGTNWVNDDKGVVTYNGNSPLEAYVYDWTGTEFASVAYEKVIWDNVVVETAPAAPTNLAIEPLRAEETMRLTWTDNANNETGFKVERSTDGTNFTEIADITTPNTATFDDTGLPEATVYYYRVLAYNTIGNSAYSNAIQGTTNSASIENNVKDALVVYPNPTSGKLNLLVNDIYKYKVVSILGTTLAEGAVGNGLNTLDLSDLVSGNYYIFLENNTHSIKKAISILK